MNETFVDDAFIRSVLDRYADTVYRIAAQYLGNGRDAEDITQEVFLSFLDQKEFKDENHVKAWLIRVTVNKSINLYKSNARKRKFETEMKAECEPFALPADYAELDEALEQLPPLDKTVVYLCYYEGYTAKEIGEMVHKSEKAVAKRLSRAREKLRKFLGEVDDE